MDIEQLLEPKEQLEFNFLKTLYANDRRLTFRQLSEVLSCCERTIKNTFNKLNVRFKNELNNNELYLSLDVTTITLDIHKSVPLDYFLKQYIKTSAIFHILSEFYSHTEITPEKLTQSLFISRSKLYKCFQHINQFLVEFDLTIKNNTLIGDELQIRYFYFLLFWHSNNHHAITTPPVNKRFLTILSQLEQELAITIQDSDQSKLVLWLQISTQRCSKKNVLASLEAFSRNFAFLEQTETSTAFRRIYIATLRNNCLSSEFEAGCLLLACLSLSLSTKLTAAIPEIITFHEELATALIQKMKIPAANEHVILSRAFLETHSSYFIFKGTIFTVTDSLAIATLNQQSDSLDHLAKQLAQLSANYFLKHNKQIKTENLHREYYRLLLQLKKVLYKPFKIAVLSADSNQKQSQLLSLLSQVFAAEFNLSLEIFTEKNTYDFIIADFYVAAFTQFSCPTFTLSTDNLFQDLAFIHRQICQTLVPQFVI